MGYDGRGLKMKFKNIFKNKPVLAINSMKEKKLYLIDIKSNEVYVQKFSEKIYAPPKIGIAFIYITTPTVIGAITFLREQAYLTLELQFLKIPLIILSLLLGIILVDMLSKINKSTIRELKNKNSALKKIRNINIIKETTDVAEDVIGKNTTISAVFLIASMFFYNRFLNDSNLVSYMWGVILFIISVFGFLNVKHAWTFRKKMMELISHSETEMIRKEEDVDGT